MELITRRSFVQAAGVVGGATACAGLGGTAARANETVRESWMPEVWDAEADAVIIGLGAAGPVAAVELAEQGCTSIVLEKMDREFAGGDCSVCGGYIMSSPDRSDPLTLDGYIASTINTVDTSFAEAVLPYINEAPAYLEKLGVDLDTESFPGMATARPKNGEPKGQALHNALVEAVECRSDKISVVYEMPAIGLVQNPVTGEVLGVKAGTEEEPHYFKANRGVVVASGSYESDREMTNAIHMAGLLYPTIGAPANTGDGLKMLMKAGCKAQNFSKCLEFAAMAVRQASEEAGTGITLPTWGTAADSYIFVNTAGERFMDESATLQHSKYDDVFTYNHFEGGLHTGIDDTRYVNAPAFMVFDQAMFEAGPIADIDGAGMGWNIHKLYTWSQDNQAEVEKGWIVKADTLEELAEKCSATDIWGNAVSIDAAGLAETVAAYNAACEAGEDDAFGRGFAESLAEGPYYAVEIIPATLYATGGASHDINAQAIDWADRPIPRLYMAGQVGDPYTLHSAAVVGAVSWGRIAAEQIAKLEAWA